MAWGRPFQEGLPIFDDGVDDQLCAVDRADRLATSFTFFWSSVEVVLMIFVLSPVRHSLTGHSLPLERRTSCPVI